MNTVDLRKKLVDWDFNNPINDEKKRLVDSQKSALALEVFHIDPQAKIGEFVNNRKKQKQKNRDVTNTASLSSCDCKSFNYAGKGLRTTFEPCMHIYRLAMELGLLVPKHFKSERSTYVPLTPEEKEERERTRRNELLRLREIPKDPHLWGGWSRELHLAGQQQDRIKRAMEIVEKESDTIQKNGDSWVIHDYGCMLDGCDCEDFWHRRIPCKHIYSAALSLGCAVDVVET